jgi:hypothetical protein
VRFLIRDRAAQFTSPFETVLEDCGLRILRSAPQAPGANAICRRLVATLGREVLGRRVPDEDLDDPIAKVIDLETARIRRTPILSGLTSGYQQAA